MSPAVLVKRLAIVSSLLLCVPLVVCADGKGHGGGGGGGAGRGGGGGGGGSSSGSKMSGSSYSGGGSNRSGDVRSGSSGSSGRSSGASYFDPQSRGSSGNSDSKHGSSGGGTVTIRSAGDASRGSDGSKANKGLDGSNLTNGATVRSGHLNSNSNSGGSDIQTASFMDKHGGGGGGKGSGNKGDTNSNRPGGSSPNTGNASGGSSNSGNSGSHHDNAMKVTDRSGSSSKKDLSGHTGDSFLNKHDSHEENKHGANDLARDRHDGIARGHDHDHDGHHDWDHHHNHFVFFFGFGTPFFGYGFYDPFWGGWGWPYYGWGGPYYPYGGLSVGYWGRHWGFGYSTGLYGWPYYGYDPCCVCDGSASYIVNSPTYASVQGRSAPIASDSVATDAVASVPHLISPPPAPALVPAGNSQADPAAEAGSADFARQGEVSFKKRDYKQAARDWRHALLDDPQNGTLILMLAQAQFQTGEYNEAAGAVQAAMRMLPKDKWGVVIENFKDLYGDSQDYVDAVKSLEKAIKEKDKEPGLRFLVGYHYLYLGYAKESLREFKAGEELAKTDMAMKELIKLAEEQIQKKSGDSQPPPPADVPKKPDGK